ncbi:MAG: iron-containing alcohol dehydrogenase [Clostridia bacterium]|nr:iron-containing alcohol dehydrogenase [Clostridia bacterium]
MSLKELTGKAINDWGGYETECSCGKKHRLDSAFFLGAGAEENILAAMSVIAPSGCGVVLVRERGYEVEDLKRLLRRGGYPVHEREVSRGDGFAVLENETIGDGVRAVLGVGGGFVCDCAKYIAAFARLRCGMVVRSYSSASFLVPSASIDGGGMPRLFKTDPPKFILCDTSRLGKSAGSANAALFGEIASRLIALYDWRFSSLVRGEKICEEVYEAALGEIDGVLASLRGSGRNAETAGILFESGLKLSALAAIDDSSRLFSGGDTACSLALEMLMRHEERKGRLRGENELLFSVLLLDIYPKVFEARKQEGFLPPPDNNMRLEKLVEYLGANERAAANSLTPYLPEKVMALCDYRIGEYEDELKSELLKFSTRLRAAYKIFRRLYADDGFSLRGYLDVSDAQLCLALAPEMTGKYGALTHLKNMGITDAYLLD